MGDVYKNVELERMLADLSQALEASNQRAPSQRAVQAFKEGAAQAESQDLQQAAQAGAQAYRMQAGPGMPAPAPPPTAAFPDAPPTPTARFPDVPQEPNPMGGAAMTQGEQGIAQPMPQQVITAPPPPRPMTPQEAALLVELEKAQQAQMGGLQGPPAVQMQPGGQVAMNPYGR